MEFDSQVIKRYLEGDARVGDKEAILDWFSDLKFEKSLHKYYSQYWNEIAQKQDLKGYDGPAILGRIYHEIKLEESRNSQRKSVVSRFIRIVSKVAAILFIPLLTFLLINRNNYLTAPSETAYSEIYSPLGTRTMFYLPDGTRGWLNGGSYLEFPSVFKGKSREVSLKGEAYFDVVSDPKKPFIVAAKNLEVIAHGTSFNVQAYSEDHVIRVALIEGNIEVSGKQTGARRNFTNIEPDQLFTYDLRSSSGRITNVDANYAILWKEGKLVFKDEPFNEVVKKINRWYNVNMVIKDKKLESDKYMATFEDETLDEVLKLIKLSAPIYYKDRGRKRNANGTFEKREIELYYKP